MVCHTVWSHIDLNLYPFNYYSAVLMIIRSHCGLIYTVMIDKVQLTIIIIIIVIINFVYRG